MDNVAHLTVWMIALLFWMMMLILGALIGDLWLRWNHRRRTAAWKRRGMYRDLG
jgi:hypothetical protein